MAQFNVYTYQFAPDFKQLSLFEENNMTPEQAMTQKNKIFADIVNSLETISYRNKQHKVFFVLKNNDFFIFRINNSRKITIEKGFQKRTDVDEPSCYVIIHNGNNVQRIAIESDINAFQDTDTITHIIEKAVKNRLEQFGLKISIKKEYYKKEFWDIVRANPHQISKVTFVFDYPNLPRVRELIGDALKSTSKNTRSTKTTLSLEAEKEDSLYLDEQDKEIENLVKGSSNSGSQISLKIKGFKKTKYIGETTKSVELNELEINGDPQKVKEIIEALNE